MTVPTPALLDTIENFRTQSLELIRRMGVDDLLAYNLRQGLNETIDKNIARLVTPPVAATPVTAPNPSVVF